MGYEAGEVCEGQLVKGYMDHVEVIELDLVEKSEPMAIFESVLLKINSNNFWREGSNGEDVTVVVQARDAEVPVH